MKVICVGTYPPKKCGIATFSQNLSNSFSIPERSTERIEIEFIAVNDPGVLFDYDEKVKFVISKYKREDYEKAVKVINKSEADICLIQHEYGIYGGESGLNILVLTRRLEIPMVAICHTILEYPSFYEKAILKKLSENVSKIVVMNNLAIKFMEEAYNIPSEKIAFIEHGVPEFSKVQGKKTRKDFGWENKKIILTFGLLNRNKGIEVVIKALPEVVKKHQDVLFIILGKTHPNIIKNSGEEYREYLQKLVFEKGISDHVKFLDQYVTEHELMNYLAATDIYISPYYNKAQITSGTLSYALGAGAAIISTPYWHACQLLDGGKGILFESGNYNDLSMKILELFDNPKIINRLQENALIYAHGITWPWTGARFMNLFNDTLLHSKKRESITSGKDSQIILPELNFSHLKRMTDNTGLIQHAIFSIPNYKQGYCLDDNARALLLSIQAYNKMKDPEILSLAITYLGFVNFMQKPDGWFRNFLDFNRNYLDDRGSEDTFGRTIWALGYLFAYSPINTLRTLGKNLFDKSIKNVEKLETIRGKANAIIGLYYYLQQNLSDEKMHNYLLLMSNDMVGCFKKSKNNNWSWFEDKLSYDNALLPLAMLCAYDASREEEFLYIGIEALNFLESICFNQDYFTLIGSDGWYEKGKSPALYAQQPIDTMGLVLMYHKAYKITNEKKYLNSMYCAFRWFLGENDLCIPMYDEETYGCNDGLEKDYINRNQGAESLIAYLLAYIKIITIENK